MWATVNVLYSDLKMLETIITEDRFFFFLSGFSFTNVHDSQHDNRGREGLSL